MARERKDRSGNWFIEHCGGALLRMIHLDDVVRWRAAHNVLSHPKQIPDGLLDVTFAGKATPDPFLIEIETYPDSSAYSQIRKDLAMVLLDRGVVPDVLVLVLCPKGNLRIDPEHIAGSAHGMTELRVKVQVVNLWTVPAEELLALGDVRLIPWVPLRDFDQPPHGLFELCRQRIEDHAEPDERENLLAMARTMAEARYNDAELLSVFGVRAMSLANVFFQTPTGQRFLADRDRKTEVRTQLKTARKYILNLLEKRFGNVPKSLVAQIRAIKEQETLDALLEGAAMCSDLRTFRSKVGDA